jgi:hypothetical protein
MSFRPVMYLALDALELNEALVVAIAGRSRCPCPRTIDQVQLELT